MKSSTRPRQSCAVTVALPGSLPLKGAQATPTSLELPEDLPFTRWQALLGTLARMETGLAWWVGDALLYGEKTYEGQVPREKYDAALKTIGFKRSTLRIYAHVARRVEAFNRLNALTWWHHLLVAKLPPDKQAEWLKKAAENKWTRIELRKAIKQEATEARIAVALGEARSRIEAGQLPIDIRHADFRKGLDLADHSVDLILTDPPYDEASLPLWDDLGAFAARVLKPGGYLIAYSGQRFKKQACALIDKHLIYYWEISVIHTHGQLRFWDRRVWNSWKPVVVWTKGEPGPHEWFNDVIDVGAPDTKDFHEWAQPVAQAEKLIDAFAPIDGLVVDPMCGSATIPIATIRRGRRAIGAELDEDRYKAALARAYEIFSTEPALGSRTSARCR